MGAKKQQSPAKSVQKKIRPVAVAANKKANAPAAKAVTVSHAPIKRSNLKRPEAAPCGLPAIFEL